MYLFCDLADIKQSSTEVSCNILHMALQTCWKCPVCIKWCLCSFSNLSENQKSLHLMHNVNIFLNLTYLYFFYCCIPSLSFPCWFTSSIHFLILSFLYVSTSIFLFCCFSFFLTLITSLLHLSLSSTLPILLFSFFYSFLLLYVLLPLHFSHLPPCMAKQMANQIISNTYVVETPYFHYVSM